jgi:hypothetical protein
MLPRLRWCLPSPAETINMVDTARNNILNCERELSAIRARIDNISNESHSREDMKKYLVERKD